MFDSTHEPLIQRTVRRALAATAVATLPMTAQASTIVDDAQSLPRRDAAVVEAAADATKPLALSDRGRGVVVEVNVDRAEAPDPGERLALP